MIYIHVPVGPRGPCSGNPVWLKKIQENTNKTKTANREYLETSDHGIKPHINIK